MGGGQGTTIPLDKPQYLFHDSETFSPLCKYIQSTQKGENYYWKHDLAIAKEAGDCQCVIESICDCGLIGVSTPIIVNGVSIATILFGQRRVKNDESYKKIVLELVETYS